MAYAVEAFFNIHFEDSFFDSVEEKMSVQKKLQINDLRFNQQKSEPNNLRVVEISQNRNKQESTVDFLSHLLAIRAIDYWLERAKYPIDVQEALKFLGLRIKTEWSSEQNELDILNFLQRSDSEKIGDLSQQLEIKEKKLYEIYTFDANCSDSLTGLFEEVENYLDNYTGSNQWVCHLVLKTNHQKLRRELNNRFKDLVSFGKKASVQDSLNFFQEINSFLLSFEHEYQQKKEKYLDKENACLRTYKRFLSAIRYKDHQNDLGKLHDNFSIAKQSLLNLYKFKIKAETYSLAIQVLNSLIRNNQIYIEVFEECYRFLTTIKANFLAQASVEENNLFLPLVAEKITNQVNLGDLQKKVEIKLGHSLSTWRRYTGVTIDDVQNAIIEEVKPIAKKICSDTYHQLAREVDSFE